MDYNKKLTEHVLKTALRDEVLGVSTMLEPKDQKDFAQVEHTIFDTKIQIQCLSKEYISIRISGLTMETGDVEYVVGKIGQFDKQLDEKLDRFLTKTGRVQSENK